MSIKQDQHNKDKQLQSQMIIYQDANGNIKLDVRFDGETVLLSQKQMAVLFNKSISTINEHIKNIFADGELVENSVIRNFRITGADGKSYQVIFYNLDVIISVGYRVKSVQGTKFRIWATQRLKEYIIKGFTLDEERLKNPDHPLLKSTASFKQNQEKIMLQFNLFLLNIFFHDVFDLYIF